jgi:hypothetical protein
MASSNLYVGEAGERQTRCMGFLCDQLGQAAA